MWKLRSRFESDCSDRLGLLRLTQIAKLATGRLRLLKVGWKNAGTNAEKIGRNGRRNTQMSAATRKRTQKNANASLQMSAKERKRAPKMQKRKHCKQPGLKQAGLGTPEGRLGGKSGKNGGKDGGQKDEKRGRNGEEGVLGRENGTLQYRLSSQRGLSQCWKHRVTMVHFRRGITHVIVFVTWWLRDFLKPNLYVIVIDTFSMGSRGTRKTYFSRELFL